MYRIAAAVAIIALMLTGEAFASTAANHVIRNTVSVDYSDAANVFVATVSDDIDITVNLVQAAPDTALNVADSDDLGAVSTNATVTVVFDVTGNANGPDDYALEAESYSGSASGNGESDATPVPDPLTLGGTTAAAQVTTFDTTDQPDDTNAGTIITVPADDDGSDDEINGFVDGDIIVLAATGGAAADVICTVNNVVDVGASNEPNGTATIYVDNCSTASGPELEPGDQIGERAQISVDITVGTNAGTLNYDAEINESGGSGNAITTVVITIVTPDLNVYKFVRNVDTDNGSCAATAMSCLQADGNLYYAAGVTADPGEELEYAVLLFNSGATVVTDILVSDDIATFTTFNAGTIDMIARGTADDSGDCETVAASGTCTVTETGTDPANASDATGDDYGANNAGTIEVSGGHNGTGVVVGDETSGGELGVGEVSVVFFSVNVNP